jgi:hypothetical protein
MISMGMQHDEAIFDATRPLVFNAIPDLGTGRPDFLDRALIVEFLSITPEMRRDEAQFWREFSERRPRILGALLDATVAGLRNLPQVKLDRPPRLADFALWVNACEEDLGMKQGVAMAACQANCAEARDLALEASPLYEPLTESAREGFTGPLQNFMRGSTLWSAKRCAAQSAGPKSTQRPEQCHQAHGHQPACCGNRASVQSQRWAG